ncbi:MAG: lytic transglycosylase domain-containing protein [Xanthomonadales bacterium]|nr:Membrane-bound lytic murein transglycosylase F [Xanthomonadales bacterium]MCC6592582.1 lytic transglycosylase domain-containing protein [Xanthomonadales bacterium]
MILRAFSLTLAFALLAPPALAARENIYKYVDRNGVTVYTNIKPRGVNAKVIGTYACPACKLDSKIDWTHTGLNVGAYKDEITTAARLNEVDESMVRAIIHAESAFHHEALSPAGAQGLMQLMPGTAGMYGVDNAFDPKQNIAAGVKHLRMLLDLFDGDFELAAAGYNAGENAVLRHGGIPPYAETQVYVQRVGILQKRYATELASAAGGISAGGL